MEERILSALERLGFATCDQVLKTARIFDSAERKTAKRVIAQLLDNGKIVLSARSKLALPEKAGIIKGKLIANAKGFGFVRPTEGSGEDIFIGERDMAGAAHGDEVLVKLNAINAGRGRRFKNSSRAGQNRSGEIIKIVSRGVTQIVGTYQNKGVYSCVVPDDVRFADEVFINKENDLGAKSGQKVCVKILRYPKRNDIAEGKIIEVLGDASDLKVSTLSIVRAFGYNEEFPPEVLEEAAKIPTKVTAEDLKGRKDYRKQMVFTIDGEDARDFDDAISLETSGENYLLYVHIADVANYVKQNGAIDKEAFRRGTSVYFPDYVLPMLPESLCNEMCSLKPNEDRLTLSVEMTIDKNGNVLDHKIYEGVIHSSYRMTYTKVTAILNGDTPLRKEYAKIVPMIEKMAELAKILIKRRDNMGQLDFDLAECQVVVNEKYETVDIRRKPRELSDRLIEQFMLITNEVVAKEFHNLDLPFVYRVHESPTPEGVTKFIDFASALGITLPKLSSESSPKVFQKILNDISGNEYETMVSKMMLRSMQKAVYFEKNMVHFGLACRDYCHFTSPIRRLADLTIHRIIKKYLHGEIGSENVGGIEEFVVRAAEQASVTERNADDVERAVDDLKKAEFMADKIGQEFDGLVSGAVESGIFVELENTVEGFVPLEDLPEDHYYFEEKRVRMVGRGHEFGLGQKIRVKLVSVDINLRRINFSVVESENVTKNVQNATFGAKKGKK